MSSLITGVKQFGMNRIMPALPPAVLRKIYAKLYIQKAKRSLEAVGLNVHEHYVEQCARVDPMSKKLTRQLVVCMVGLPQTGKTTVAQILAQELGLIHINSNEIRGWLRDELNDPNGAYKHVNEVAIVMMEQFLVEGYSVVMDSDHVLPAKRCIVEAFAKPHGAVCYYVNTWVAREIWESRLSQPGHHFHRLYTDAVSQHPTEWQVSKPLVACAKCEREGQVWSHEKYGDEKRGRWSTRPIRVDNNSSLQALESTARQVALLLK